MNVDDHTGGVLHITPHLREGLKSAHVVFDSQWLWVDAVCITQDDEVEKAQQVPEMDERFGDTGKAIVWLGEDYEDGERAMSSTPLLSSSRALDALEVSPRID